MAIYTQLLAEGYETEPLPAVVVYTVPEDQHVILRDIVLAPGADLPELIALLATSPGGIPVVLVGYKEQPQRVTAHWQGRQVLLPGTTVSAYATDGSLYYRLTGYVFAV